MVAIDVCIVAGRRPDLLSRTLASMYARMLVRFPVRNAYMNLDPIFGDEHDRRECIRLFEERFPKGIILEPERPSFCAAVQRLWSTTTADFVVHLEDDWICLTDIGPEILDVFNDSTISQLSFHTAEKKWDVEERGHFHHKKGYVRIAGLKIPTFRKHPIFTTSPSILRGNFARECAALLDLSLDPEKQFYSGSNLRLESHVVRHKNYIFSPDNRPVLEDVGRDWRESRGLRKVTKKSRSTWVQD